MKLQKVVLRSQWIDMTDFELNQIIEKSLRGRVTPISSAAILTDVPYGQDYQRGRQLIWIMVESGLVECRRIQTQAKVGTDHINVYKWIGE